MAIKATHFTPQVLLSAPRRSAGVPNPSGSHVLYTTSTYSFETHKKTSELRVLDVKTGETTELARDDDISDLNWLDDDEFVCLQAEKDGSTSIFCASLAKCLTELKLGESHYVVHRIDAPIGNLKATKLDDGRVVLVVSAKATSDHGLFNPEKAKKTHSTGRLYSKLFVRHWDSYTTKEKNALWVAGLAKDKDARYQLDVPLKSVTSGLGVECPIEPFGGTDNFDVSEHGIIFVAKDPELDPALNVKCNVYLIFFEGAPQLIQIDVPGFEGAATSPVFSPDGTKAAFLAMAPAGYEAAKNHIFIVENLRAAQPRASRVEFSAEEKTESWDRSPSSITFTADGKSLLLNAEELGYGKLFTLPVDQAPGKLPKALTQHGYVGDAKPLANGNIFVSSSSLVDNSVFTIIDPHAEVETAQIWTNSNSAQGSKFGLKSSQISSIWTPASNPSINKEVHSWVYKPSGFDSGKKYPVAYLIHGRPQGSWGDNWSTRWNPAVFAEQGYIVVAPNPTGSTGYGQAFTDAIKDNWGGDPYEDIVKVFEWVGKNLSEADNDKSVMLGASYGGYMANWIQGHDLGRKFKAIVCHDGIFSTANSLSTEELYFPFHELGGTPWYDPGYANGTSSKPNQAHKNFGASTFSDWRKWDPAEHLANWSTPELVIHSSKDYRLCISEGLAAFNVLQARGVESQFLTFPDENHWVLKPENSLVWHKTVLNFINKYVGLPAFAKEDEESEEFFGGVREAKEEEAAEMPAQGKPET